MREPTTVQIRVTVRRMLGSPIFPMPLHVNKRIRKLLRRDDFLRHILPPIPSGNTPLDRQVDTDRPVRIIDSVRKVKGYDPCDMRGLEYDRVLRRYTHRTKAVANASRRKGRRV